MRVLVFVKATPEAEAGQLPPASLLNEMQAYNESLFSAGIIVSGAGLKPSSAGVRVHYSPSSAAGNRIEKGPFKEHVGELVSGFWEWKVKDMDEALEWVGKAPFGEGAVIEIRQIAELEDFGEQVGENLKAAQMKLQAGLDGKNK